MCIFYFRYFDVLKTGVITLKKWSKKLFFPLWKKLHFKYCNKKGRLKRQFFSVVVQQESLSVSYFCEILPKHGNRYKDMQIGWNKHKNKIKAIKKTNFNVIKKGKVILFIITVSCISIQWLFRKLFNSFL
jgi:hypothetical protein